jgi:hypothetical protein
MTATGTYRVTLPGPMLQRGFWLYVWRVMTAKEHELLYVGRTGDNSSPNASPPYTRFGQHLGLMKNNNALRQHLGNRGIEPDTCLKFDFIAHGPIHAEVEKPETFVHSNKAGRASLMKLHLPLRNIVGAMERQLAVDLSAAGYDVMNTVKWKHEVVATDWQPIRAAFAEEFPRLKDVA